MIINVKNLFDIITVKAAKFFPIKQKDNDTQAADKNQQGIFNQETKDPNDKEIIGEYNDLISVMDEIDNEIKPKNDNYYIVKPNDNFTKIAKNLNIPLGELMRANPGINYDLINIGQKIVIPEKEDKQTVKVETASFVKPNKDDIIKNDVKKDTIKLYDQDVTYNTYKVVSNDNLSKIAQKFKVEVSDIKLANNLSSDNLNIGQALKIPNSEEVTNAKIKESKTKIHKSDMPIDLNKTDEYKKQMYKMMNDKGFRNKQEQESLADLIIKESVNAKIDPIFTTSIISQETNFRYKDASYCFKSSGYGIMQLTKSTVEDIYRLKDSNNTVPNYLKGSMGELFEIFKEYPTATDLFKAVINPENYELNLKVGLIILKGKLESVKGDVEKAAFNYNGNTAKSLNNPKIEVREEYRQKVTTNYNKHKIA